MGEAAVQWEVPEDETNTDPLLDCLEIFCKFEQRAFSANAIISGLPLVENRLTPQLFVRAAERLGFSARLVKRPLKKISKLVLPVVLLLEDNVACVLRSRPKKGHCEVIFPDSGDGQNVVEERDLKRLYTGYAIFVQPVCDFDKRTEQYHTVAPKSWFWGTIWGFRGIYSKVALAALLVNVFVLVSPLFVMNVYDKVVPNNAVSTLIVLAIGAAIAFFFDFLVRLLRGYFIDTAGKKADILLASRLFQHVLDMKMIARPASSGAFANNLREFEGLRDFFTSASMVGIIDLPFIILFVWMISLIGGPVAWVALIAIPIVIIGALLFEIPMRRAVQQSMLGSTQKHAILIEAINGTETIKSLACEGQMQSRWEDYVASSAKAGLTSRLFSALAVNFTTLVLQMVTVATVCYGVVLISQGDMTVGALIACTILSGRALAPLAQITGILTRYQQSRMALKGLNQIMQLPVERPENGHFLVRPTVNGEIHFENVSFSYPDQQVAALKQISIHISAGERVGVIGRIGSGKSTIEKLVMGLYHPSEGAIRIDGTDINQLDPADLRRNIGFVGQDGILFFGTVRDNIALGARRATDADILKAAKIAGVDRFVSKHPAGYDLPIGERGEGISGGQRQAIMIARAIVGNPSILLLDEPTSAMDNSSEQELIAALPEVLAGRTLMVVTHRASLLALVERLIVIDDGAIVADGPKDKVLKALAEGKKTN